MPWLLAAGALLTVGGAVGASPPSSAVAPATTTLTWAWGASANLSISASYVGAYNSSATGLGGNLTVPGALVAFSLDANERYAAYAVVTATFGPGGNLSLAVAAAQYRGLSASESIQGTLPVAGTYGPNASIPLANQSAAVSIREGVLDAARAFLNYTSGGNGSLTLRDEHLQYARAINISLSASHFPNVTAAPGGGYTLKYVSGALSAQGFLGLDLRGSFSPGLLLVPGPVNGSTHWRSITNVSWNGTVGYASAMEASLPNGPTYSTSTSARAQFVRNDTLALSAGVIGTRTLVLPNGTAQTEYVVNYTLSSTGAGAEVVDGLFVVPSQNNTTSSTGLVQAVPIHRATAPLASHAGPATRALVPAGRTLPHGAEATPANGQTVTGVPMSPNAAETAMSQLGHPGAPDPSRGSPPYGIFVLGAAVVIALGALAVRREIRKPY